MHACVIFFFMGWRRRKRRMEEKVHLPECLRNVNTRLCFHLDRAAPEKSADVPLWSDERLDFFFIFFGGVGAFSLYTRHKHTLHTWRHNERRIDWKQKKKTICLNNYQKSLASFESQWMVGCCGTQLRRRLKWRRQRWRWQVEERRRRRRWPTGAASVAHRRRRPFRWIEIPFAPTAIAVPFERCHVGAHYQ